MPILVISGPVGAGKTTVARELLSGAPAGTVAIEGDDFWKFLVKPFPAQSHFKSFTMTMRAMFSAAHHYHRDDYTVLLDFTVPPSYLPAVKRLLRDAPFDYVVLLPPEDVCASRAAGRERGAITDYAPYHDFYAEFDTDDDFVIREPLDVADVVTTIRSGLQNGRFQIR